jgi:hypothetical protein
MGNVRIQTAQIKFLRVIQHWPMMEAASTSEMSENFYQTTRHIPADSNFLTKFSLLKHPQKTILFKGNFTKKYFSENL